MTFDKEAVSFPCWSRDGRFLAIENQRGSQIAVIPSTGGAPIQLTSGPGVHLPWDWSPDGDKVSYAGDGDKMVYTGAHDGVPNIWWVSMRTRQIHQVTSYTSATINVLYPTWSPRGDQIVYSYAETTGNIWMMRVKK
jgi:TolB protein